MIELAVLGKKFDLDPEPLLPLLHELDARLAVLEGAAEREEKP